MILMNKNEYNSENRWKQTKSIEIWGRECNVDIIFQCYDGNEIEDYQEEAFDDFMEGFKETMDIVKNEIFKYCRGKNPEEIAGEINIFKFIKVQAILVKRDSEESHKIAIICKYKYDIENGIAVMIINNEVEEIGYQDIAL